MSNSWPQVPLGEVLTKSEEWTDINPTDTYREITVRLWGKGVTLRREANGSEIGSTRRVVAKAGQFILSRIDARNGAFGLVPDSLDGAVVSNDFPLFTPNPSRLLPSFLGWMSKTRSFVDICKAASEGTTNRVRLQEDRFLKMTIPLPPIPEQRRIVARIEELAAKIREAGTLRQHAVKETEALLVSCRRTIFGESSQADWIPLANYVESIENGKSPATDGRPASADEWGVLKVGAVSFGFFNATENKALPLSFVPLPQLEVKLGDFIMSRANTRELVGACAVVRNTRPKLMLSDKTFRFVFREPRQVVPAYLEQVLKSPALREQIEREASGTSPTMKNISKQKVLALRLPPFAFSEQRRILGELDALQTQVDAIKKLQANTAAELDALLPSLLDKAFKGEL